MTKSLLNENQQRRVGTHLRLLAKDSAALQVLPQLHRPGEPYDTIQQLLTRIREQTEIMRLALGLPADRGPSLRRQVTAVAEVWAADLEDLRPKRLKTYGKVHPDLGHQLDPLLDEILELLFRLADTAAGLPETGA